MGNFYRSRSFVHGKNRNRCASFSSPSFNNRSRKRDNITGRPIVSRSSCESRISKITIMPSANMKHKNSRKYSSFSCSSSQYNDTVGHLKGAGKGTVIDNRYKVICDVGLGTFGRVDECLDTKKNSYMAIKIIRNIRRYRENSFIEVDIL